MNTENRIRVSENFFLDEFIDPHTYFSKADHGKNLLDDRLWGIAQEIRNPYKKPLAINNWWAFLPAYLSSTANPNPLGFLYWAEAKQVSVWSGYRSPLCHIGAKNGAHYKGLAIDLKGPGKELYKIIKKNPCFYYNLGVRRLEDPRITPSWLHVDTWNHNTTPNSIRVVDLKNATEIITW